MGYTAAVLVDGQRQLLRTALAVEAGLDVESLGYLYEWRSGPLPHHMTINRGDFDEALNRRALLGMPAELVVDGFWYDHDLGVVAARVVQAHCRIAGDEGQADCREPIKTITAQPHITMCLKPGIEPFLSNKLSWAAPGRMLREPLTIKAQIEVIT
jgi:hypothetical protein